MDLQQKHMKALATILRDQSGLIVSMDKQYLIETRLRPVMATHKISDWDALIQQISGQQNNAVIQDIVEAMTTNETLFFRDPTVFKYVEETILPEIMANKGSDKSLKIWSCASSTGQEAYSLSMMIHEMGLKAEGWNWTIYGSDIDNKVIRKAEEGLYTQFEVQRGMPAKLLIKYFEQPSVGSWQIKNEIKQNVRFFQSNLLNPKPPTEKFDLIFCRNVLFYMCQEDREKAVDKMLPHLRAGGYLILGTSEFLSKAQNMESVKNVAGVFKSTTA